MCGTENVPYALFILDGAGKNRYAYISNHIVHHGIYHKQNYSCAGVIEAFHGALFDVVYVSFDDGRKNPAMLEMIEM